MKSFLRDMPLRGKLFSYAGVMLTFIMISFSYSYYSLNNIGKELTTIVEEDIPLTQKLSRMTILQLEQAISFERALHYGAILTREDSALGRFQQTIEDFDHGTAEINQVITQAYTLLEHGNEHGNVKLLQKLTSVKKSLKHIQQAHENFIDHAHQTFNLFIDNKPHLAELMAGKVELEEQALDQEAEELLANIQLFTQQSAILAQQHEQSVIETLTVITLVSMIIGVAFSMVLSNFILSGIRTAIVTASGDLTKEIEVTSKDEIGELLHAMNGMKGRLVLMIRDITGVTDTLSTASEEMSVVTEQRSMIINEHQGETELVATARNEMTSTVHDVSDNIAKTASYAREVIQHTVDGGKIVETAVFEINKLSDQISQAAVTVNELEQHSHNINSVMDVIKSIAEQTNLLALNAAIEAARAGEQGRGFAVVADEVRTLAVRTQTSTKEINQMIEKLQVGTRSAVEIMEQSRQQTETAVSSTQKSGSAFEIIASSVQEINDMCQQISDAAEEQGQVSEEINRNIVKINDMSAQSATGAEQTSVASQNLAGMASDLKGLVSSFSV